MGWGRFAGGESHRMTKLVCRDLTHSAATQAAVGAALGVKEAMETRSWHLPWGTWLVSLRLYSFALFFQPPKTKQQPRSTMLFCHASPALVPAEYWALLSNCESSQPHPPPCTLWVSDGESGSARVDSFRWIGNRDSNKKEIFKRAIMYSLFFAACSRQKCWEQTGMWLIKKLKGSRRLGNNNWVLHVG